VAAKPKEPTPIKKSAFHAIQSRIEDNLEGSIAGKLEAAEKPASKPGKEVALEVMPRPDAFEKKVRGAMTAEFKKLSQDYHTAQAAAGMSPQLMSQLKQQYDRLKSEYSKLGAAQLRQVRPARKPHAAVLSTVPAAPDKKTQLRAEYHKMTSEYEMAKHAGVSPALQSAMKAQAGRLKKLYEEKSQSDSTQAGDATKVVAPATATALMEKPSVQHKRASAHKAVPTQFVMPPPMVHPAAPATTALAPEESLFVEPAMFHKPALVGTSHTSHKSVPQKDDLQEALMDARDFIYGLKHH
jgi:hypothetical protein